MKWGPCCFWSQNPDRTSSAGRAWHQHVDQAYEFLAIHLKTCTHLPSSESLLSQGVALRPVWGLWLQSVPFSFDATT